MVEVSLTVGKLDASLALLLTKDHHLIEFPTILLPNGVKSGSIVKIRCDRDLKTEAEEAQQFQKIQDQILSTFGKNLPQNPVLKIKNVTQTSCVLEWDKLDLGTASLKNLVLFKDGKKLGSIPQPLTNTTSKLSGLPIDKTFKFQLQLDTTAGVYSSETIEVRTHKMTDLSGITVCLGDIAANEHFTIDDIQATLQNMGAHYPADTKLKVDTTHYITTRENKQNPEFLKANEMNIPIIRPEWLKACERERRIVGVREFYVKDCALPDIFARNYWQKAPSKVTKETKEDVQVPTEAESVEEVRKDGEIDKEGETPDDVKIESVPVELAKETVVETPAEEEPAKDDDGVKDSEVPEQSVSEKRADVPQTTEPVKETEEVAKDSEASDTAQVAEIEVPQVEDPEITESEATTAAEVAETEPEVVIPVSKEETPQPTKIPESEEAKDVVPDEEADTEFDLGSTPAAAVAAAPTVTDTQQIDAAPDSDTDDARIVEATASTEFDEVDISAPPVEESVAEKAEEAALPSEDTEESPSEELEENANEQVDIEAAEAVESGEKY